MTFWTAVLAFYLPAFDFDVGHASFRAVSGSCATETSVTLFGRSGITECLLVDNSAPLEPSHQRSMSLFLSLSRIDDIFHGSQTLTFLEYVPHEDAQVFALTILVLLELVRRTVTDRWIAEDRGSSFSHI